jgi:hypothetical protein
MNRLNARPNQYSLKTEQQTECKSFDIAGITKAARDCFPSGVLLLQLVPGILLKTRIAFAVRRTRMTSRNASWLNYWTGTQPLSLGDSVAKVSWSVIGLGRKLTRCTFVIQAENQKKK